MLPSKIKQPKTMGIEYYVKNCQNKNHLKNRIQVIICVLLIFPLHKSPKYLPKGYRDNRCPCHSKWITWKNDNGDYNGNNRMPPEEHITLFVQFIHMIISKYFPPFHIQHFPHNRIKNGNQQNHNSYNPYQFYPKFRLRTILIDKTSPLLIKLYILPPWQYIVSYSIFRCSIVPRSCCSEISFPATQSSNSISSTWSLWAIAVSILASTYPYEKVCNVPNKSS